MEQVYIFDQLFMIKTFCEAGEDKEYRQYLYTLANKNGNKYLHNFFEGC